MVTRDRNVDYLDREGSNVYVRVSRGIEVYSDGGDHNKSPSKIKSFYNVSREDSTLLGNLLTSAALNKLEAPKLVEDLTNLLNPVIV